MYYKTMYYKLEKGEKRSIIFLHGWKGSNESFNALKPYLKDYNCYYLDLPGFGSSRTNIPPTLKDYAKLIQDFIVDNKIENPLLVGHSFGGRVLLKLKEYHNYDVILISSPAFDMKSFKVRIKLVLNKIFKLRFPSKDYKNASLFEKIIMRNALADTKRLRFRKMKNMLIIHSKTDKTVKYKEAIKLNKKVKDSYLIPFGKTHFPYLENPYQFAEVIKAYAKN